MGLSQWVSGSSGSMPMTQFHPWQLCIPTYIYCTNVLCSDVHRRTLCSIKLILMSYQSHHQQSELVLAVLMLLLLSWLLLLLLYMYEMKENV